MRRGDPVDVSVDTYSGRVWHGTVDSISPATGSAFSVLPSENASGNWVKITQRVTVKIKLPAACGRSAAARRHEYGRDDRYGSPPLVPADSRSVISYNTRQMR